MTQRSPAPLEELERALETAGFDSEREAVHGLVPVEEGDRALYGRLLSRLKVFAKAKPRSPAAYALAGKLLLNLGRASEAEAAFDRALALDSQDARALRWRGQCLLMTGRFRRAQTPLDAALALQPGEPRTLLLLGVARILAGEREAGSEILRRAAHAGSAAAHCFLGWAQAGAARAEEAEACFERALALQGEPWIFTLRALMRAKRGEPAAALEDLSRALRRGRSPWTYAHRAAVREDIQQTRAALIDVDRALALRPGVAGLWAQRGRMRFEFKRYRAASQDLTAAVRLAPEDARLRAWRAEAFWVEGRHAEALRDLDRALRVGALAHLRWRRLQILLFLGAERRAASEIKALLSGPDAALGFFARGYLEFRRGRHRRAAEDFIEAESRAGAGAAGVLAGARQYAAAALAFAARSKETAMKTTDAPGASAPRLYLCGMGIDYPAQATVEVLESLSRCDVVFSNLEGERARDFLMMFCRDVRPLGRQWIGTERRRGERVLEALRRGRTVGFVTRGHPLLFGGVSFYLIERCRKEGFAFRALSAVSTIDAVIAGTETTLGHDADGVQAFGSDAFVKEGGTVNPAFPLFLYLTRRRDVPASPSEAGRLADVLQRRYPGGHRVGLYNHPYLRSDRREFPLSRLRGVLARIAPEDFNNYMIVVPALTRKSGLRRPAARRRALV